MALKAPLHKRTYIDTTRFTKLGSRRAPHWSSKASIATELPACCVKWQESVQMTTTMFQQELQGRERDVVSISTKLGKFEHS